MIFNNGSDIYSMNGITESPYPLGLEGALMHVYENECNYNAIMKSVGISELRYYQETGKDLFVHEAGAFGGFIAKAKAFFKKIIEKIKSIFKKFAAMIGQFTMKDKDFVKKYQNDILRRDLTDFEYDGYTFKGLDTYVNALASTTVLDTAQRELDIVKWLKDKNAYFNTPLKDSDAVTEYKEKMYGEIACSNSSLSENELRDEVKELCYGDKESFNVEIRKQFTYISEAEKSIKDAKKAQDKLTNTIDKIIKNLDKIPGNINKTYKADEISDDRVESTNKQIKAAGQAIEIYKSLSNALTIAFGVAIGGLKDRNRQAKAICVKALSYKHEAATYESYNGVSDIFADVVIR